MSKEKRKRQKNTYLGLKMRRISSPVHGHHCRAKKKNRARDVYASRAPSLPNPDHVGGGGGGHGC